MIGGIACYFVVNSIKEKLRYNDTLDAFGIHGVGGVIGAILTGVFQSHKVNKRYIRWINLYWSFTYYMDTMYCSYSSSTLLDYYNFYYWKDIINFMSLLRLLKKIRKV